MSFPFFSPQILPGLDSNGAWNTEGQTRSGQKGNEDLAFWSKEQKRGFWKFRKSSGNSPPIFSFLFSPTPGNLTSSGGRMWAGAKLWGMWLLPDQRSCGLKSWGKSLFAYFSPFVLYHRALGADAITGNARQSGQTKGLAFWPEHHESETWRTGKHQEVRESLESWNKMVYELLGSPPSYTCMDLTLSNFIKGYENQTIGETTHCMGYAQVPHWPLADTHRTNSNSNQ